MSAMGRAGLRPVGVDLSAFGMIRALARESYSPVEPGDYVDAPEPRNARRADRPASRKRRVGGSSRGGAAAHRARPPLLQPGRRHESRRCPRLDLPVHSRLTVRRGGNRPEARRTATADPRARPCVARPRGHEQPLEGIEGDAQTTAAARDALAEGAARLVDELRLSLEYYAAQEAAVPIEGVVACGPGTTIPGLTQRLQRDLGQRFEIGRPRALAHLDGAAAARLTLSFGLALGSKACVRST